MVNPNPTRPSGATSPRRGGGQRYRRRGDRRRLRRMARRRSAGPGSMSARRRGCRGNTAGSGPSLLTARGGPGAGPAPVASGFETGRSDITNTDPETESGQHPRHLLFGRITPASGSWTPRARASDPRATRSRPRSAQRVALRRKRRSMTPTVRSRSPTTRKAPDATAWGELAAAAQVVEPPAVRRARTGQPSLRDAGGDRDPARPSGASKAQGGSLPQPRDRGPDREVGALVTGG